MSKINNNYSAYETEDVTLPSYKIRFDTTDNAIKFVSMMNTIDGYFDINMGSYIIDAKSLLGVLSMDPQRVMTLEVIKHDGDIRVLDSKIKPFCV